MYSIYAAARGKPRASGRVPEAGRDGGVWEGGRVRVRAWRYPGQYGGRACWTASSNGSRAKRMGQSSTFWGLWGSMEGQRVRPGGEISNLAWGSPGLLASGRQGWLQASGLGAIAWSQCPQCAMQPICRCGQIGLCCSATSCPARRLSRRTVLPASQTVCLSGHWLALQVYKVHVLHCVIVQQFGFQSGRPGC